MFNCLLTAINPVIDPQTFKNHIQFPVINYVTTNDRIVRFEPKISVSGHYQSIDRTKKMVLSKAFHPLEKTAFVFFPKNMVFELKNRASAAETSHRLVFGMSNQLVGVISGPNLSTPL
jgi:hypothetical protein